MPTNEQKMNQYIFYSYLNYIVYPQLDDIPNVLKKLENIKKEIKKDIKSSLEEINLNSEKILKIKDIIEEIDLSISSTIKDISNLHGRLCFIRDNLLEKISIRL